MEDYLENCTAELGVLRRKLQSKAEALLILTQELEQCRTERDQLKLIAQQVPSRSLSKKTTDEQLSKGRSVKFSDNFSISTCNGFDHYLEVREQNRQLRLKVQDLEQKLTEAYGDIKVLRAGAAEGAHSHTVKDMTPAHQREELIEQLEQMSARVTQLQTDLRSVLDEKEELVIERESYRSKVHRLNYQISVLLKGDSSRVIDLDALLMDNKYLQEQLQQLQAEKEMFLQALAKYKSMLDKKRNKGVVKLGTHSSTMVVSHKQVQELLSRGTTAQLPNTEATLSDLRDLCMALLEALQDKSLALAHQKKANKILANRISELEQRLGASVSVFPSELLLQGYSNGLVNGDLDNLRDDLVEKKLPKTDSPECNPTTDVPVSANDQETNDVLPEDIQQMVTQALKEIQEEESKTN